MSIWDFFKIIKRNNIDWEYSLQKITPHFQVHEAIWLARWQRLANDEDDNLIDAYKKNLVTLFNKMEIIRDYFNRPIIINSAYRPPQYNRLIGGAKNSAHLYGMAADWYIPGLSCNRIRATIKPKLEEWGIRCEDLRSTWVHIDIREPIRSRFFKP